MNDEKLEINPAPIVEAVLDIECDLPPSLDLKGLEAKAKHVLEDRRDGCGRKRAEITWRCHH